MARQLGKQPTDLAFAKRADDFLEDLDKRGSPDFRKLEPNNQAIYALRILCEAWRQVNVIGESSISGIPINAPDKIDQWQRPFGSFDSATIAAMIGDDDISATAQAVFDAVEGGGDVATKVNDFLKASEAVKL